MCENKVFHRLLRFCSIAAITAIEKNLSNLRNILFSHTSIHSFRLDRLFIVWSIEQYLFSSSIQLYFVQFSNLFNNFFGQLFIEESEIVQFPTRSTKFCSISFLVNIFC